MNNIKEHVSVDTQSGLLKKTAATPADVSDGLGHICPDQGAVYSDKGYWCAESSIHDPQQKPS
ncbi:MAG: hypothetical protein HRT36_02800 [Alphaproteobacteria bacterium]|nr:hypothetical protein [Alphaproteobacteria bacterium]